MKRIVLVALLALLWGTTGYLNYGATLASFTAQFPDQCPEIGASIFTAVGGPLAIPAVYLAGGGSYGNRLYTPLTHEQRWRAFDAQYELLGRDYFESKSGYCPFVGRE